MEEEKTNKAANESTEHAATTKDTASTQSEQTPMQHSGGGMGKVALAVVFVVILGVLAWAGWQMQSQNEAAGTTTGDEMSSGASADMPSFDNVPDVVAKVGDTDITKEDYIATFTQSWQTVAQQGGALNTPEAQTELSNQVLEVLINTELLVQAAADAGMNVSAEEVDAELATLQSQLGGEEALQSALDEIGMSAETLRKDMARQLSIEAYLAATAETSSAGAVTDAEVQARYDEVAAQNGGELPALSEVADVIKAQLEAEAQQAATQSIVDELRESTEIEIFLQPQEV